ncbi:MAG: hypothetical protein RL685_1593 [Pseudomonadota bacterium]
MVADHRTATAMIGLLVGVLLAVAVTVVGFNLIYRLAVWALRGVSRVPGLRRLVSVESNEAIDTFKLTLGGLFTWNVAVNSRKGTIAGSIQIDSKKQWGPLAVLAALLGALLVPSVSALLMPAALIVVGVGLAKGMLQR